VTGVPILTEPISARDAHTIDTLIVPGACNVDDVRRDRELIDWMGRRGPDCGLIAPCVSQRSYWQRPGR